MDNVVIDREWRKIPTLIFNWVDSVVIAGWTVVIAREWRKIPTLI